MDPFGLDTTTGWTASDWVPIIQWLDLLDGIDAIERNFDDMRITNTIGADKYFHCLATCEATEEGPGGYLAALLVNLKELKDVWKYGVADCKSDLVANKQGRDRAASTCAQTCASLRPAALPAGY